MADFQMIEREPSPGTREICIRGEFDRAVATVLETAIEDAAEAEALRVDLSECEFMDSVGVALLVEARQRMEARERQLVIAVPRGQVARILTLTGVVPEPVQLTRRS
jgi:anti-sigma B factor antagonist